jgi:hypothetical protein
MVGKHICICSQLALYLLYLFSIICLTSFRSSFFKSSAAYRGSTRRRKRVLVTRSLSRSKDKWTAPAQPVFQQAHTVMLPVASPCHRVARTIVMVTLT